MALNAEMGLYREFNVTADGIPYGCHGLEEFKSEHWLDVNHLGNRCKLQCKQTAEFSGICKKTAEFFQSKQTADFLKVNKQLKYPEFVNKQLNSLKVNKQLNYLEFVNKQLNA